YALIALLHNELARAEVEELLHAPEPSRIGAVNLAETVNVLRTVATFEPSTVSQGIRLLELGGLLIEPADAQLAKQAGELRATHYRRKDRAILLADCFALALAMKLGESLATADSALLRVATTVGAHVIALPDSSGRRPQA
ncbi:MAG: PIN domain-containing protein, partial [Mycobacteriales bacterium]